MGGSILFRTLFADPLHVSLGSLSAMATRKVVYDDQDTNAIQYNGQWHAPTFANENIGNFGPPYLHTLHGTNQDAQIFFEFDGTEIEVYGSTIVINSQTNPDPNLECFVDGVSIGREPIFFAGENNWKLCGKGGFSAGPHKLQIDITVQSPEQTFWLDQIRYTPSPSVPLDGRTIMFTNTDPAIHLDDNWGSLAQFNSTSKPNAVAHVDFIGTSVSWVGYIPVELPHGSAFGTYSVDDGKPITFELAGLSRGEGNSQYNQVVFTTQEVEIGHHTLTVTFQGSASTTPLTLDYLYINNGTHVPPPNTISITGTGTIPSPTTLTNSDLRKGSGLNVDALLGGVIGVLGLLIIIAGAFLYRRRRRLSGKPLVPAEHAPMHVHPYRQFQTNVYPNDVLKTPILPPIPSMKARETYHAPIQPLPDKSLSAKWREAFGFKPQYTDSP